MYALDVVRQVAQNEGIPITQIGLRLGKTRQYVSSLEQYRSNPRVDTMAAMLDVCGYSLCAVPSGKVPDDALVID